MWQSATESITQAYRKLYSIIKPCQTQNWMWDTTNISQTMNRISWEPRFAQKWSWILQPSGAQQHAVLQIFGSVSEQPTVNIFRKEWQTKHNMAKASASSCHTLKCSARYHVTDILQCVQKIAVNLGYGTFSFRPVLMLINFQQLSERRSAESFCEWNELGSGLYRCSWTSLPTPFVSVQQLSERTVADCAKISSLWMWHQAGWYKLTSVSGNPAVPSQFART
jgi:hypothetical protein